MKTITVVGIGDLMLPDMELADINTKTEEEKTVVSSPKIAPLVFDSYEEMEQARANTAPEDAPFLYDYCDLFELEHYYLPVYAEQNYELQSFSLNGGSSGIVFLSYYFEEAAEEVKGKNLTLQMKMATKFGKNIFQCKKMLQL